MISSSIFNFLFVKNDLFFILTDNITVYSSQILNLLEDRVTENKTNKSRNIEAAAVLRDLYNSNISIPRIKAERVIPTSDSVASVAAIFEFRLDTEISRLLANSTVANINKLKRSQQYFADSFIRAVYTAESGIIEDVLITSGLNIDIQNLSAVNKENLKNSNLGTHGKLDIRDKTDDFATLTREKWYIQ